MIIYGESMTTIVRILITLILVEILGLIVLIMLAKPYYKRNHKQENANQLNSRESFSQVWLELVLLFVILTITLPNDDLKFRFFFSMVTSLTLAVGTIIEIKKAINLRRRIRITTGLIPKRHYVYNGQIALLVSAVLGFNASAIALVFGIWLISVT